MGVEATRLRARREDLREGHEGVEREAPGAVSQSLLERDAVVEPPAQGLGLVARRPGPVPAGKQDSRLLHELARGGDPARQPAGDIEVREARRRIEPVATRRRLDEDVGVVDCSRPGRRALRPRRSSRRSAAGASPRTGPAAPPGSRRPWPQDGESPVPSRSEACTHGEPEDHREPPPPQPRSNYRPFCNCTPTCDSVRRRSVTGGSSDDTTPWSATFASSNQEEPGVSFSERDQLLRPGDERLSVPGLPAAPRRGAGLARPAHRDVLRDPVRGHQGDPARHQAVLERCRQRREQHGQGRPGRRPDRAARRAAREAVRGEGLDAGAEPRRARRAEPHADAADVRPRLPALGDQGDRPVRRASRLRAARGLPRRRHVRVGVPVRGAAAALRDRAPGRSARRGPAADQGLDGQVGQADGPDADRRGGRGVGARGDRGAALLPADGSRSCAASRTTRC